MIVNIKSWIQSALPFKLEVSESEKIFSVKAKLETRTGLSTDRFQLIFEAWRTWLLDDQGKVSDYKIKEGATLRMVYKYDFCLSFKGVFFCSLNMS